VSNPSENISGNIVDLRILRRLVQFLQPYRSKFVFLILLTLSLAVLAPLRPFLIQITIDDYLSIGDYRGLVNMILLLVAILFIQAIVQYSHTYLSSWLGQSIIRDIRIRLFDHLLRLRLKFFDNTPIGKLVTRNISDIETLSNVFSEGLAAMMGDLLQLIFILIFMFAIDWRLTLVSLSTLPFLLISTYVFKEKIKVAFNQVRNAVASLNAFVQEHITGMSVVQIFNSEKEEYQKFEKLNEEHRRANIKSVMYYSIYFPVAEVIGAVGIGLIVWYGAKGVISNDLQFGVLVSFILYLQMFFRPIRMIADRFNTLQLGIVSSSRILRLLDNQDFIANNGTRIPVKVEGNVSFEKVWFAYNEEDYVLKDISFDVKSGETLALVGETGAGKSSVINLLNRFYDISRGKVLIDGVDIQEYDLYALRRNIGLVLQDVFLFSDTVAHNISMGNPEIEMDRIIEAAELVGARKFIERLPGAFNYNVMERGATLSVGQRQLISFVRAMVYNPKILVLDEATSSVDSETEELIQKAILKLMQGRTSIVIAHRLSTIQKANRILVMDKGEIKERGTHEELLEIGGFYSHLHRMQYKEVI